MTLYPKPLVCMSAEVACDTKSEETRQKEEGDLKIQLAVMEKDSLEPAGYSCSFLLLNFQRTNLYSDYHWPRMCDYVRAVRGLVSDIEAGAMNLALDLQ